MKKVLIFVFCFMPLIMFGQIAKIPVGVHTNLPTAVTYINLAIDQININTTSIGLKSPISNPTFIGTVTTPALIVGGSLKVKIDSITSDGATIKFYHGATQLTATPGVGGGTWGGITGTLSNQVDLTNILNAKADLNSPTFIGTVHGIDASMVSAMSTSHAANVITGTNITNWNTAYGWGDHSIIGYALSANVVPTTRTVNGHALSSNVSVTSTDLSLGNVTNESKATMFTNSTLTGTTTIAGIILGATTLTATGTEFNYVHGVTSSIQTQLDDTISINAYFMKLVPDSVQHTDFYTIQASDVYKDQMCLKGTSIAITLPANLTAWPVGTWMNFLQEGAGILVFKKASGVRLVTPLDSIATSGKGDMISIKKIGISAYMGTGNLTN